MPTELGFFLYHFTGDFLPGTYIKLTVCYIPAPWELNTLSKQYMTAHTNPDTYAWIYYHVYRFI